MGEPCAPGRLPGRVVMIMGQVGYQVRLLTRTPRALWPETPPLGPAGSGPKPPSGRFPGPAMRLFDAYPMPELGTARQSG